MTQKGIFGGEHIIGIAPRAIVEANAALCNINSTNNTGFPRLLESPGKSWIFFFKIPGPGKSWKLRLKVLESPGKISLENAYIQTL